MRFGFDTEKFRRGLGQAGGLLGQAKQSHAPSPDTVLAPAPTQRAGTWLDNRFGSSLVYKQAAQIEQEKIQGNWYGGVNQVGSRVSLTDQQLVVSPLDTDKARKLLVAGARLTGMPAVGTANSALKRSGLLEPRAVALADVTSVERLPRRGLQPPGARLSLVGGENVNIRVSATPFTPTFSRKNAVARDDLVTSLEESLARLRDLSK